MDKEPIIVKTSQRHHIFTLRKSELSKEEEIYLIKQVKQWYDEGKIYHVSLLAVDRNPNPSYFINNSRNVLKSSDGIIRLDCETREEADNLARKINENLGEYKYQAHVYEEDFGIRVIVNSSPDYSFVSFAKSRGILVFCCFIEETKTVYVCGVPSGSNISINSLGKQFEYVIKENYPHVDIHTSIKKQKPFQVRFTENKSDPTLVYGLRELKKQRLGNVNYHNLSETELNIAFVLNLLKRSNLIRRNNQLNQIVRIIHKITEINSGKIKRVLKNSSFLDFLPERGIELPETNYDVFKEHTEKTEKSNRISNKKNKVTKERVNFNPDEMEIGQGYEFELEGEKFAFVRTKENPNKIILLSKNSKDDE